MMLINKKWLQVGHIVFVSFLYIPAADCDTTYSHSALNTAGTTWLSSLSSYFSHLSWVWVKLISPLFTPRQLTNRENVVKVGQGTAEKITLNALHILTCSFFISCKAVYSPTLLTS